MLNGMMEADKWTKTGEVLADLQPNLHHLFTLLLLLHCSLLFVQFYWLDFGHYPTSGGTQCSCRSSPTAGRNSNENDDTDNDDDEDDNDNDNNKDTDDDGDDTDNDENYTDNDESDTEWWWW